MQKDGSHVLSTPLRLDADERFTGKGVTIAFLDSGFYPHVDLTDAGQSHSRLSQYERDRRRDRIAVSARCGELARNDDFGRRGGKRQLSNGFYRGIAPDANVVLVKLARTGRITEQNIQDGLEWILENREKYDIKIVNISAGGDFEQSYLHDSLSQTVEECVAQGINGRLRRRQRRTSAESSGFSARQRAFVHRGRRA